MKKLISLLLAVSMLLCLAFSSAYADGTFSASKLAKGDASNSASIEKTTGNGVAAQGNVTSMTSNATFFFRVWKNSTWQASNGKRVSGTGSFSLTTLYDGNDNPRLWKGTSYYIAVTHSSYSSVTTASTSGTWHP